MKRAIILAAGLSTRMRPLTGGRPKCLLELGGETLIGRNLRLLRAAGVHDITVVVGHAADAVAGACRGCLFVVNPRFATTNTAFSLELALRPHELVPVVVLNGDVWADDGVIDAVVHAPGDSLAAVKRHGLGDEEVKVTVDGDRVTAIGKHLDPTACAGEAFGLYRFTPGFAMDLRAALRRLGDPRLYYEHGMDRCIADGASVAMLDVGEARVAELDFPRDYVELRAAVEGPRAVSAVGHPAG